jgi:serine/alanine adding enzyme
MNPPSVPVRADGRLTVSSAVDGAEWDSFVRAHPDSTGYHLWQWRRIFESAFSHQTEYLAARRDSAIVGVLPLVVLRSRLFGRFMVSLPFVNYGGILADADDTHRALLASATDLARDAGLSHIELRHRRRMFSDLPVKEHKVAMLLNLPTDPGLAWQRLQSNVRNHVRKAQKRHLQIRVGGRELVNDFYGVFARNMRDLGTPVYSRGLFALIAEQFPDNARIFTVSTNGRTVAASFTYSYRDAVEVPWSSSLREYRELSANNLMYWTMIEHAIDHGHEVFDFGRSSPGDGPFQFKRQWGALPEPMYWEYALLQSHALPDQSPKNPKFRLAINAWKHMPVGLANLVGPRLVRSIP